ncbi:nicotinamide N-methyltransferase-like [Alligator mississippiensis]|uniref:nicotinamide N-methyltransferase-like n=1 Tax=Alligator mississippiensis TaxID=8496 RepID=UPI002877A804|nr:nicotinamide N-methyltransferase-like [Alligator mississippiensis]
MDTPASFTEGEVYQAHFHPRDYLETWYNFDGGLSNKNSLMTSVLRNLHKVFSAGDVKGDTLIDIGSGPTIYHLLSACEKFNEIIISDYTDRNRQELEKWLKKEPGAFDWTPAVKYVCELEGQREKWAEKEEKLRKKVKQVLKCDVRKPNPLAPVTLPAADCLLSMLCLEAACKDLGTFRAAVKNISSLVKPGGHLVLNTVLKGTYYLVGQHNFSCLGLDRESVEAAVRDAGCIIEHIQEAPEPAPESISDYTDLVSLVARKQHAA